MWKLNNFPATQILREINFCSCGVSKYAILTVLAPLIFTTSEYFTILRATNELKIKVQSHLICQNSNFWTLHFTIIDFTENMSGRKILKILHCATLPIFLT